ncbi:MAG: glycosyltransferase family 87 protein [Armatimonadota bacterium]
MGRGRNAPPTGHEGGPLGTGGARWAWVWGVVLLLVTAVMVGKFLHHDYKDAEVWYDAGRRALEGRSLAGLPHYRYPPTFAVLAAPLAALGWPAFFFIWYATNVVLFAVSVWLTGELVRNGVTTKTLRHEGGGDGRKAVPVLAAALVAVYAVDTLFLGQTNILIMALVYWAFLADLRGKQWVAGWPLGAAIAIKVFPVPLLVYFLYRRRFGVVASGVVASVLLLFVLPGAARGFGRNAVEVREWADRVAAPFVSHGRAGDWGQHSLDFGNQSLPAVARRLLTRVNAQVAAREGEAIYVNVAGVSERVANAVVVGLSLLLALGLAYACGWGATDDPFRKATEYALATALLLLTSALSWTYFFVMLLLPAAAAARLLGEKERLGRWPVHLLRASLIGLGVAAVLLASQHARAVGCVFWASLLLYVSLGVAAVRMRMAQGLMA